MRGVFRRDKPASRRWREAHAVVRPFSRRCVFVIGPARSGTTVLQNALNASDDFFLLGEPGFESDDQSGFAVRYRERQAAVGNLENKSTAVPPLFDDDPPWWMWLRRLSEYHRRVGAKIAINPGGDPAHAALLSFQGQVFYDAAYIFVFRDPVATAVSRHRLNHVSGEAASAWQDLFSNTLSVMRLYVRMAAVFPNVTALLHEDIDTGTFARLGAATGCDLSMAAAYYNATQVRAATQADVPEGAHGHAHYATEAYRLLRDVVAAGNNLVQSNQNIENIDPGHRTPFGRLAMLLDPVLLKRLTKESR